MAQSRTLGAGVEQRWVEWGLGVGVGVGVGMAYIISGNAKMSLLKKVSRCLVKFACLWRG